MATGYRAAAEMPTVDSGSRLCQFTKTKVCKFHTVGKCTKGTQCPFAHEGYELRKLPDLRCTKICKALIQTGVCTKKPCMYAHSKQELRSTGAFHKTKLCRFMQTGHCTLGAKCNFAHSAVELREPETIEGMDPPPGLGLESMVSGLLSDDDDEEEVEKALPLQGLKSSTRNAEKDIKSDLPLPAYVPLGGSLDAWSFGAQPVQSNGQDRRDLPGGHEQFKEDVGMESFWDTQNLVSSNAMGFSELGFYPPEGNSLAYSGAFHDPMAAFPNPWAGGMLLEQYASLFGNAWDYAAFSDNVGLDHKDELKIKSGFGNMPSASLAFPTSSEFAPSA